MGFNLRRTGCSVWQRKSPDRRPFIEAMARSLLTALIEASSEREKGASEREDELEVRFKGVQVRLKVQGRRAR